MDNHKYAAFHCNESLNIIDLTKNVNILFVAKLRDPVQLFSDSLFFLNDRLFVSEWSFSGKGVTHYDISAASGSFLSEQFDSFASSKNKIIFRHSNGDPILFNKQIASRNASSVDTRLFKKINSVDFQSSTTDTSILKLSNYDIPKISSSLQADMNSFVNVSHDSNFASYRNLGIVYLFDFSSSKSVLVAGMTSCSFYPLSNRYLNCIDLNNKKYFYDRVLNVLSDDLKQKKLYANDEIAYYIDEQNQLVNANTKEIILTIGVNGIIISSDSKYALYNRSYKKVLMNLQTQTEIPLDKDFAAANSTEFRFIFNNDSSKILKIESRTGISVFNIDNAGYEKFTTPEFMGSAFWLSNDGDRIFYGYREPFAEGILKVLHLRASKVESFDKDSVVDKSGSFVLSPFLNIKKNRYQLKYFNFITSQEKILPDFFGSKPDFKVSYDANSIISPGEVIQTSGNNGLKMYFNEKFVEMNYFKFARRYNDNFTTTLNSENLVICRLKQNSAQCDRMNGLFRTND